MLLINENKALGALCLAWNRIREPKPKLFYGSGSKPKVSAACGSGSATLRISFQITALQNKYAKHIKRIQTNFRKKRQM